MEITSPDMVSPTLPPSPSTYCNIVWVSAIASLCAVEFPYDLRRATDNLSGWTRSRVGYATGKWRRTIIAEPAEGSPRQKLAISQQVQSIADGPSWADCQEEILKKTNSPEETVRQLTTQSRVGN